MYLTLRVPLLQEITAAYKKKPALFIKVPQEFKPISIFIHDFYPVTCKQTRNHIIITQSTQFAWALSISHGKLYKKTFITLI